MLRKLALMMALSPAIWLSTASALGLGEIDVKSALNQRFSASIPLNDLAPDEIETLQVGLAQNEAFVRAGLERSDYLGTLSFTVETDDGASRIVINSRQIAREPYFSLLMDVRSRGGHVLRQFTILLDPPDYALSKESQPVALPAPVAAEPQKPQKKTPAASAHSGADPSQATASNYGPVAVGETLWSVATRLRPRPDITMDQMQLALYKANPTAFENGHIGKLLKGITLKVPGEKAITAVSPDAAKLRIQQLRAGPASAPVRAVAKEPEVTKAPESPKAAPVVPAPAATPAPEVAPVTKAPKAPAAATATKPAPIAPVVPAAKPAPAAAASAPASAVATPEEPASAVAVGVPAGTATNALPLLEETASSVTATAPDAASGVVAESASAAQVQPVEPVKPYIPPPLPPAPEPTPLMEEWKEPIMLYGGLAAAASLLGWFLISRRKKPTAPKPPKLAPTAGPRKSLNWQFWKKSAGTTTNAAPSKVKPGKQAPIPTPVAAPAQAAFDEEQFERDYEATQRSSNNKFPSETQRIEQPRTETSQLPNFDSTQMFDAPPDAPLPAISTDTVDFDVTGRFEAETLKIDLNSNDPVAEADFHLAYGLYDEAALHLKQAAQKQPDRVDIPTKLAEVYFRAGKAIDFMEVAEGLKPRLPQAEWTKVALMGKQLSPDSSLFQGIDTDALATDMDMTFDEPAPVAPVKSAPAAEKANAALEFDLTSLDMPKVEQPKPMVDTGNSLEFRLEDFDLEAPAASNAPKAAPSPAVTTKVDAPLEFDLSAFDLGGDEPAAESVTQATGDDFKLEDFDLGMSDDSHAISTGDEASTKLDLARAYVDMGDNDMARSLLNEVLQQGSATQKSEAQTLLGRLA